MSVERDYERKKRALLRRIRQNRRCIARRIYGIQRRAFFGLSRQTLRWAWQELKHAWAESDAEPPNGSNGDGHGQP